MSAPTGADAVIPEPARFGGARLALLRLRARGRLRLEGRVTLGTGTWKVYCALLDHEAKGMTATLTVAP